MLFCHAKDYHYWLNEEEDAKPPEISFKNFTKDFKMFQGIRETKKFKKKLIPFTDRDSRVFFLRVYWKIRLVLSSVEVVVINALRKYSSSLVFC